MPKAYASEPPAPHRTSFSGKIVSILGFSSHLFDTFLPENELRAWDPDTRDYFARVRSTRVRSRLRLARGCEGRRTREGRHGHVAHVRVRGPVHARRPAGACRRGRRGVRAQTNEPSRALEPMRALKPARYASGGCQTATVAHQRPRFKTAPTTSKAAPNRTSTASTSNVNEKPARKSSGRPST